MKSRIFSCTAESSRKSASNFLRFVMKYWDLAKKITRTKCVFLNSHVFCTLMRQFTENQGDTDFCEETSQTTAAVPLYFPLYYFHAVLVIRYVVNRLFCGKWQRSRGQRGLPVGAGPRRGGARPGPSERFPWGESRSPSTETLCLQQVGFRAGRQGMYPGWAEPAGTTSPGAVLCSPPAPEAGEAGGAVPGPGRVSGARSRRRRLHPQAGQARAASGAGSGRAAEGKSFSGARGACALGRRVRGSGGGRGAEPGTRQRSAVSVQARPPFSLSSPCAAPVPPPALCPARRWTGECAPRRLCAAGRCWDLCRCRALAGWRRAAPRVWGAVSFPPRDSGSLRPHTCWERGRRGLSLSLTRAPL